MVVTLHNFLFVSLVKQAFSPQALFELLKGTPQSPVASFLHLAHDQLVVSAVRVDAQLAAYDQLIAVFWVELDQAVAAGKHGAAQL